MKSQFKKMVSGLLATILVAGTFAGCGKKKVVEDKRVVTLPAEQQILLDTYQQNPNISEWMTYTSVTATYIQNPESTKPKIYVGLWQLYDNQKVQVDCMDLITIGKSTMGDIVNGVDKANKTMISNAIENVRKQRQDAIDAAYEEARAAAAAKGKTYTKEKQIADVSDLSYVEPYTYRLAKDTKETKKEIKQQYPYDWYEYDADFLVDPAVDKTLYLFVYKYGAPYVQYTFKNFAVKVTNASSGMQGSVKLYNSQIDQEKDWVLTGIAPADCSFLVDRETLYVPPYVDQDWRSLGSKNNMITEGNIRFGGGDIANSGDGFTWDSLMTLCHALELSKKEDVKSSWRAKTTYVTHEKNMTYIQTSDDGSQLGKDFTYCTIYLPINQMFVQKNNEDAYVIPFATMTATFDRKTNNCINWSIDYTQDAHVFKAGTTFEVGSVLEVNTREHKLDTTDYNGMLQTVDNWVKENAVNADFGYYLVDDGGAVIGKLDNGLSNYHVDPLVNGEQWYCVESPSDDSKMEGRYVNSATREKVLNSSPADVDEALRNASQHYFVVCMATTIGQKGKIQPLAYFDNTGYMRTENSDSQYFIHSIEYDKMTGYKNAVIIDGDVYNKLLEMYIRTFRFNTEMQDTIEAMYEDYNKGALEIYKYMKKWVEERETEKVKTQQQIASDVLDQTQNPTTKIKNIAAVIEQEIIEE